MAAFGISFPKLTLCRSTTSKADTNTVSATATATTTTTATITPALNTRTLSLSIKNVPSQPIHYDVSTTTIKQKTSPITTILAIDGETKQLPKNLSVFNELRLNDGFADSKEKRNNSTDIIIPSSLSSPMGPIDCRSDIEFHIDRDFKKTLHDRKDDDKLSLEDRRSNHTFTPPTSSLSHNSSSCDLQLTSSSISVDLPQLKYAIEKFLVDDDNPIYQVAEEFSSGFFISHQDQNVNMNSMDTTKLDLKNQKQDQIVDIEFHSTKENKPATISNSMKWYVSELRIHRPFIYQTPWIDEQQYTHSRRISHSVSNLNQIYDIFNRQQNNKTRKSNDIIYSSLSLQNFLNSSEHEYHHHLNDNILLNNHLSSTNDDLRHIYSDEDEPQLSPLTVRKIVNRHSTKDDTLIRNESVKKKLFDILNDDELENACLEDMSQEFEKMSLNHPPVPHRDLPTLNSFSSSSDDALYASPPNELSLPSAPVLCLPLSTSYNENLSLHHPNTTEQYFGRSRLITTSLDKISANNNYHNNCSTHSSSSCLDPSTDEHLRPSWSTSPSPHWRMDEPSLPMPTILKRYSSMDVDRINDMDSNRFLSRNDTQFNVKENKYIHTYNHDKEQKHVVSYSLMNKSTSLVDSPSTILPIIHDKSSNLIMFI